MPNALIYSPDFDGHRQVYALVLADILKKLGFEIFIAGDLNRSISNSFYIDQLQKDQSISFIDTGKYKNGGLDINREEFLDLQNKFKTDLTVFAEADNHIQLFNSQISFKPGVNKRLRGQLAGIFLRPFYYYEKEPLTEKLRYLKHMHKRWRKYDQLFHEFLRNHYSLVATAFFLDENFADKHRQCTWIPDVFQEYADTIVKDEIPQQRVWIEKLDEFKAKNSGRFLFLYFGTSQFRRGYDILLKMAADKGGCFIHCGLYAGSEKYTCDTDELRSTLSKEGRLFETNQFIEDTYCIEYFFKSVSHIVLPYRNFYGSSGVMLQALNFGVPVMAPSNGIIGYRINKYNIGVTYNESDKKSLYSQFDIFKNIPSSNYKAGISEYMKSQTAVQLKNILSNAFAYSDTNKEFSR